MADPDDYRFRVASAIAKAIADASTPAGETKAVILASQACEALIANMAILLASSPSAATPAALEAYCRSAAERLRGETEALQADRASMRYIVSETLPGARN